MEFENHEIVPEKGHYETVKEYTKDKPVYDENGNQIGTETVVTGRERKWVWTDEEEIKKQQNKARKIVLKDELSKIKEDVEQEAFGLVRDDYEPKKARAAEIINELRILEGKEPRATKNSTSTASSAQTYTPTTSYVQEYLNSIK